MEAWIVKKKKYIKHNKKWNKKHFYIFCNANEIKWENGKISNLKSLAIFLASTTNEWEKNIIWQIYEVLEFDKNASKKNEKPIST